MANKSALSLFLGGAIKYVGDWEIFPGPPERARAETGVADQWVLKQREFRGFASVNHLIHTDSH